MEIDKMTAATITDNQIRALRTEAGAHGDDKLVKTCTLALTYTDNYEEWLRTSGHKRDAAWEDVRRADAARATCAKIINEAADRG